jgi:hypothetical protein
MIFKRFKTVLEENSTTSEESETISETSKTTLEVLATIFEGVEAVFYTLIGRIYAGKIDRSIQSCPRLENPTDFAILIAS